MLLYFIFQLFKFNISIFTQTGVLREVLNTNFDDLQELVSPSFTIYCTFRLECHFNIHFLILSFPWDNTRLRQQTVYVPLIEVLQYRITYSSIDLFQERLRSRINLVALTRTLYIYTLIPVTHYIQCG